MGLVPTYCAELVQKGSQVFIQSGAGKLSGYDDTDYQQAGAQISPDAESLYEQAELII